MSTFLIVSAVVTFIAALITIGNFISKVFSKH